MMAYGKNEEQKINTSPAIRIVSAFKYERNVVFDHTNGGYHTTGTTYVHTSAANQTIYIGR